MLYLSQIDEALTKHRGKDRRTAPQRAERNRTMNDSMMKRMNAAMKRIGGPLAVLDLPEEVRNIITNCPDYETRVKMLEMVADKLGK